ncbi:MAG: RnfABCDGE type electron transport complex subunit G [Desulfobacteraceae bacterium]|nr:RnfABCDGE type electron transport complex subunit G [Desulfobacteraceae bacterium]MBC2756445.1 RnfABCDGE type electron transport complex subunit G [Desulfobacteraceae bacterium]MBC2763575.1 RnfABCDGE type electron transport complex subunit G [ANME-2 cluster archaeon]
MNTSQQTVPDSKNRLKDLFIFQAWLVLLLASFFGAALAGIQLTLSPKIEANKLNETLEKVPELILGADAAQAFIDKNRQMEIDRQFIEAGKKIYSVFQAKTNGQTAGWVVKSSGQGYAGKIELLIGVDAKSEEITGLFILDQKETPGLGNKIMESVWRKQFINKSTQQQLTAVKTKAAAPNEINAITGATISSKSVCGIVNQSLENLRQPLASAALNNQNPSDNQPNNNQEKK